jgi:hypothetical protein
VLACALGPVRAAEIEQILATIGQPPQISVQHLVEPLQRFVIGRPDSVGYALSHPKLADFLQSADNGVTASTTVARTKQTYLHWGRTTLKRLEHRPPTPDEALDYEYLLTYYSAHLLREGATIEDFMALVTDGWGRAWYAFEGGYRGFAGDVATCYERLGKLADHDEADQRSVLVDKFRCALCLGSINS